MFLIKNFMKLALCLLLIFKNSHAIDKKNTKNLKDQIYDVRTHAGPMGMGLTKSYQINNQKICVYNTINGQEQIILKSLDKCPIKRPTKNYPVVCLDFGIKQNILRNLNELNFETSILPATSNINEIMENSHFEWAPRAKY